MNYYSIDPCPTEDFSFCVLDEPPEGTIALAHRMARGFPMGDDYPENAKCRMSDKYKGIKLPTLIASTDSLLVLARPAMELFRATRVPMEILGFTLYNHKNRVASREYSIVNVLGNLDCLNAKKSDIEWEGADVVEIYECVLDPHKLKDAPEVFRVKEDPSIVVIGQRAADAVLALRPTNVHLSILEQA